MSRLAWALSLAALLIAGQPAAAADVFGTWKSPKNSVHLDIRPCGEQACGYVIWASPGADADARKGSGKPLVGQQLLRDFRPDRAGWKGKVYAPDINRTFSGTAKLIDDDKLEARGCILGGLLCKTQIWQRVRS